MHGKMLKVLVLVALAGVAFAGTFFASHWLGVKPTEAAGEPAPQAAAKGSQPEELSTLLDPSALTEQQALQVLIREVRGKLRECEGREKELQEEQRRLGIARQDLEKQTAELENLRVELATQVSQLKQARETLDRSRVALRRDEEVNLKRTAAIYDKMAADAASRIFESMCKNSQEVDAVKILHYMTERAVAKILAEMSDKEQAARLSEMMKRVRIEG
jgi:flagellar motility protein MotE (MotC chaperone)